MLRLSPVNGPKCPKCHCQDSAVLARHDRFGDFFETRKCRHCEKTWRVKPEPEPTVTEKVKEVISKVAGAITYHVLRCPHCQSKDTVITSTRKPLRHHKCKTCKKTFQSVEE